MKRVVGCVADYLSHSQSSHAQLVKAVPLEHHRTINLASNTFLCEPLPPPVHRTTGMDAQTYMPIVAIPDGFTCWDRIIIDAPDVTLGEFIALFKAQHHACDIDMLATTTGQVLYNSVALFTAEKAKLEAIEARLKVRQAMHHHVRCHDVWMPCSASVAVCSCGVSCA